MLAALWKIFHIVCIFAQLFPLLRLCSLLPELDQLALALSVVSVHGLGIIGCSRGCPLRGHGRPFLTDCLLIFTLESSSSLTCRLTSMKAERGGEIHSDSGSGPF